MLRPYIRDKFKCGIVEFTIRPPKIGLAQQVSCIRTKNS
jgi:hypothetical protein